VTMYCVNCKSNLELIDDEEWVDVMGRIFCPITDETHRRDERV